MGDATFNGFMFTADGGIARKMVNKTGAASVKGTVVETGATVANSFALVGVGDPDPVGVVYEDGVADGSECYVVFTGAAKVFYVGATSLHDFARVCVAGDTDDEAGKAISEAAPVSPFATDKHFQEIGHVIEAIGSAGLALTMIHFN